MGSLVAGAMPDRRAGSSGPASPWGSRTSRRDSPGSRPRPGRASRRRLMSSAQHGHPLAVGMEAVAVLARLADVVLGPRSGPRTRSRRSRTSILPSRFTSAAGDPLGAEFPLDDRLLPGDRAALVRPLGRERQDGGPSEDDQDRCSRDHGGEALRGSRRGRSGLPPSRRPDRPDYSPPGRDATGSRRSRSFRGGCLGIGGRVIAGRGLGQQAVGVGLDDDPGVLRRFGGELGLKQA